MNWTEQQARDYMTRRLASEQRARERIQNHETNPNLGAISDSEHQHDPAPALARGNKRGKVSGTGMAYRVSIISVRHRLLDRDNLIAGSKWLRDQIAATIGLDDSEGSGLEWEYSQILTKGAQGVIVRIEQP